MKKLLFTLLFASIASVGFSQIKLGLKVSPNFSWNRLTTSADEDSPFNDIKADGIKIRFGATAFLDFEFADNYAINTGIGYTNKGSGVKVGDESTPYSLQYLEIPLAVKLFTNEIGTDMRMYFQVGIVNNINLSAKIDGEKTFKDEEKDETLNYTKHVKFFDLAVLMGAGIEMQMGSSTAFLAGLSYNRGLLNVDANYYDLETDGFTIKNDYLAIDLGLKF